MQLQSSSFVSFRLDTILEYISLSTSKTKMESQITSCFFFICDLSLSLLEKTASQSLQAMEMEQCFCSTCRATSHRPALSNPHFLHLHHFRPSPVCSSSNFSVIMSFSEHSHSRTKTQLSQGFFTESCDTDEGGLLVKFYWSC